MWRSENLSNATFICNKTAYEAVKGKKGFKAVRHGFIPMFLPVNFESRVRLIEIENGTKTDKDLGKLVDIFDDDSILLCDLDGHAKGQIGVILNTDDEQYLLAADSCWVEEAYKENWLPNKIVRFIFDDWDNYLFSLKKVQNYYKSNPKTIVVPCHCEKTMWRIMS